MISLFVTRTIILYLGVLYLFLSWITNRFRAQQSVLPSHLLLNFTWYLLKQALFLTTLTNPILRIRTQTPRLATELQNQHGSGGGTALLSSCGGFSRGCRAQTLSTQALAAVAHRLSCPMACRIFPDQGLNPCPLHWHADSSPLDPQGNPTVALFSNKR